MTNAKNTTSGSIAPKPLALSEEPNPLLRVLSTLLGSLEGSMQPPREDLSRWSFKDYSRSIDKLLTIIPPERAIETIKCVVSSPLIPSQLRPRILASASHSFLRQRKFAGALAVYKLLVSQRFAPPISLIAAMYRAASARSDRQAPVTWTNLPLLSLGPLDVRSLALLLSTLERSRQPEIMENVVRDYAAQISPSCLTDAYVVASMIRGYHVARQLDGCYAWFYRFRNDLSTKDKFIPATPYVYLMVAARKLNPTNTKALYRIINMMQEDGIPLITVAYNEIIASELQNRNFKHVFSLFSAFQRSPPAISPDAHTFSLMFDALWKNATGPMYDSPLHPEDLLSQLIHASKSKKIVLSAFHVNSALRYFVYVGDFRSATAVVDAALSARVSPNTLTIRWTLEEILKRCQRAFDPSASLELENWAKLLLGGLTRDHFAHTAHLLDVVRSTRIDNKSYKLTRSAQDALQLVHNILVSCRPLAAFASQGELRETPVLAMIHDVLGVE
ncbi:hypothetical protein FRC10_001640 [Ceratobasidium sp. 414]|nr:hypothetical protein FRC10_001640 [Ceratobasidium sp. 414]